MAEVLDDLELAAWQALLHTHHQLVNALDAELREEHDITFGEYDVLLRLARTSERELTMTELARRVMITPSGLTRAIDRLVEEGLVERQRDAADARVVRAHLTAAGRDRIRRASRTHLRGIRRHFTARLTRAQLRSVAAALGVISGPHQPH
jgi:DNA-binding MarR family transcriptional regulator